MRTSGVLLGLLAAASGCAPSPKAPIAVYVLALDATRNYVPTRTQLYTLGDAVALTGTAGEVLGGASIVIDPSDPLLQDSTGSGLSDSQVAAALTKNPGSSPHADYFTKSGALYPADYWSWAAVSHYANLEAAFHYWQNEIGVPSSELGQTTSYLAPSFVNKTASTLPLTDDSFYVAALRATVFLPAVEYSNTPTYLNLGNVAHEYSHKVFSHFVYADSLSPPPTTLWSSTTGLWVMLALDEGLADYHGYGATCSTAYGCDPRYLSLTFPSTVIGVRDFTTTTYGCLSRANISLLNSPATISTNGFQYVVGTAIASALYFTGLESVDTGPSQRQDVERAVFQAYNDDLEQSPGFAQLVVQNGNQGQNVTLGTMLNAIATHLGSGTPLQTRLCNQLKDRLGLLDANLPACPTFDIHDASCPDRTAP